LPLKKTDGRDPSLTKHTKMVKLRLARRGRKKLALYDVIVADARAPRDGRFIEKIGTYNPNSNPATINLDDDKALDWLMKGAQPTDTVRAMLSYRGVLFRKHLQVGVNKGAVTQEQADARFAEWKTQKENKISGKVDTLAQKKAAADKARLEAESKKREARAEAINRKNTPPAEEAPAAEQPAEGEGQE
jgi:small subunit ribosomal protein S16